MANVSTPLASGENLRYGARNKSQYPLVLEDPPELLRESRTHSKRLPRKKVNPLIVDIEKKALTSVK